MNKERMIVLLAYAVVCFQKCTNPFELIHLQKKKVTADECRDLSSIIANIIYDSFEFEEDDDVIDQIMEQARKDYEETQK